MRNGAWTIGSTTESSMPDGGTDGLGAGRDQNLIVEAGRRELLIQTVDLIRIHLQLIGVQILFMPTSTNGDSVKGPNKGMRYSRLDSA